MAHVIWMIKHGGLPFQRFFLTRVNIRSETNRSRKPNEHWKNKDNVLAFLSEIQQKYNLKTPDDWNSITISHITSNGGTSTLLRKHSMYELKCLGCPEGKESFNNPLPPGHWENIENVRKFLSEIKEKYNFITPEDWNSLSQKQIQTNEGGWTLARKYSLYELKCIACPEGKLIFTHPRYASGYWENIENVLSFLSEIQQKYNLNTPEDWNSITQKHIQSVYGGASLLKKYSLFKLKCLACPEGESVFDSRIKHGFWEKKENILQFLSNIKEKYNIKTPEDWDIITQKHIKLFGGNTLLKKYSIYELKYMACPEGKSMFNIPNQSKPLRYWENEENIEKFFSDLKETFNLKSREDWKRISKDQIISQGGSWLYNNNNYLKVNVKFDCPENNTTMLVPFTNLVSGSINKRSSQRWLFLQIQKLYPNEEIVEDYYHSEISRISGFNVQFDIFMIERNIVIEYHGKQHYEDIPSGFSGVETYQNRDIEKEKLCAEHGIRLIVIPYWWDNKLESLETFLRSKITLV